ncbi:MAG: TlpA disulfide reductase family protein [Gammaproteobacteria bacterium]|nr:TlpA disulfide reductase family protein [Gammaproteobacteria bacterium]
MSSTTLAAIRLVSFALIFLLAGLWFGARLINQSATPPPVPSAPLVEQLPAITLGDLNEQPRSITEWSGQSLLINFWATWCAPCREEMPLLQSLHEERRDQPFEVIGIAADRLPDVERFITETGVTYPQLVGQQEALDVAESFGPEVLGLPFSVFVGPAGEVLGLRTGALDPEELRDILATMDAFAAGEASLADTRARLADG